MNILYQKYRECHKNQPYVKALSSCCVRDCYKPALKTRYIHMEDILNHSGSYIKTIRNTMIEKKQPSVINSFLRISAFPLYEKTKRHEINRVLLVQSEHATDNTKKSKHIQKRKLNRYPSIRRSWSLIPLQGGGLKDNGPCVEFYEGTSVI